MKQCAGCGKRYDMAQANCPNCWTRPWVKAAEGNARAELPDNPNPCPRCGYLAAAGMKNCPHCRKRLRPLMLDLICVLGLLASPTAIIYGILTLVYERDFIRQVPITRDYWIIPDLLWWIPTAIFCWGIMHGQHRALRGMRLVLIGAPVLLVLQIGASELLRLPQVSADLASLLLQRFGGGLVAWLYFATRGVQDYCAVGKPKERYQVKEAFLEESHISRKERVRTPVTRNL